MGALMSPDRIEGAFLDGEHRRIREGLAMVQDAVIEFHRLSRLDVVDRTTRILTWLRRDLLPHASWEDAWLYPRIDREAGSPWATRSLRFEHEQVRAVAGRLGIQFEEVHDHWNQRVAFGLLAALARLDALISSHLLQEERFITPFLHGEHAPALGRAAAREGGTA